MVNPLSCRRAGGSVRCDLAQLLRELETAGKIAPNAQPVIVVVEEEIESMFGW